jgi:hypothetical protein
MKPQFDYTPNKEKEFKKAKAESRKTEQDAYMVWAEVTFENSDVSLTVYKHTEPGDGGVFEVDDGNASVIWGKTPAQAVRNWVKTYG